MVSEFQFIENIRSKYLLDKIGDDCAVLPKDQSRDLLLTADMLIEDVDFRLEWTTPELLGHKALAASLSDIAAMGGTPLWGMLSLGVPATLWDGDFVNRFYVGWNRLARHSDIELVGGDISRSPSQFVIDSIVCGEVEKGEAILRSGARLGDAIVVTGKLGGSAAGLRLFESVGNIGDTSEDWQQNLRLVHLQPWPQVGTGIYLQQHKLANAMIDLSDGLSSDMSQICHASSLGARIDLESLPLNQNLRHFTSEFDEQIKLALNGGEDFELLFTTDKKNISQLDDHLFTVIGEMTSNAGIIEITRDGRLEILEPRGFQHFG